MNVKRIIVNSICICLILAIFIWIGKEEYKENSIKDAYNTQNLTMQTNVKRKSNSK